MRTWKKRTVACNRPHKGSKFALTRESADFRVVQLSQVRVKIHRGEACERPVALRFSAPRLRVRRINNMTACEGLVRCGETGVSATFNAVREPYAGKARTYGSSGATFPRGNAATLYKSIPL